MSTKNIPSFVYYSLGVATAALVVSSVSAQSASGSVAPGNISPSSSATAASDPVEEIVVTGSLIRGIAPVGNNVIGIGKQKIEESGAATSGELLAKLPQNGLFGLVPFGPSSQVGSNASNPISRPNLRPLPAAQTSGGAQTLILIDGHRVVGAGTQQIGVDPDILAPGAVERVEALTDGGSAVYGSDAIGGVINFITRKRFNGVDASARVGLGDKIKSFDSFITAGKDWGKGGLYVSYNYSHHDAIFGRDRDYIKRIDYNTGVPVGRNCAAPNVTPAGSTATYVVSGNGLAAGGPVTCDPSDDVTFYPRSTLHNVYARLNQDLADWLSFDMTTLWARRDTVSVAGPLGSTTFATSNPANVTLTPANPYYRPMPGVAGTPNEVVSLNYASVFGPASTPQRTLFSTWEIAPQFTIRPFGDWQVKPLFSYGRSSIRYDNTAVSSVAQAAYLGVSVNPFDLTGPSSNATNLSKIVGHDTGFGHNELYDYRLIADGTLFQLPGGAVKIAFGGEHTHDIFSSQVSLPTSAALLPTNATFTPQAVNRYTQKVNSVFGEAQIPIIGRDIGFAGMRELLVSLSGRYDKYNDFGHTFNPKVGLTWKPISWVTIRGNWGKSFTAPSPVDQLGTIIGQARIGAVSNLTPAPQTVAGVKGSGQAAFAADEPPILLINGSAPGLQPQRARNWSVGGTIDPPFIHGLTLSVNYYHISLDGTLGRPVGVDLTPFYQNFPDLYLFRPTGAAVQQALTAGNIATANTLFTLCNPTDSVNQAIFAAAGSATGCTSGTSRVGALLDTRARNLGTAQLSGIDFSASYVRATGFGSVDASFAGNVQLRNDTRGSVTSPVVDNVSLSAPDLKFQTTLGADIGHFRAQGTWNHMSGYDRAGGASVANFGQGSILPFNTVDLFMKYNFAGQGVFKELSVSLNVQNIFDASPPLYKSTAATAAGIDNSVAFTLGRFFQLSVRKKF